VSALEQEPFPVSGVAIGTGETLLAALLVPGFNANFSLANAQSQNNAANSQCPFKVIRVRGTAWATITASIITLRLRQGVGVTGTQVGPAFTTTTAAEIGFPLPFEFLDSAPAGLNYSLTASGSVATNVSAIINMSGFDG
jgi:hypothetical protein